MQLPGMLYAKFVNATVPHAKVLSVDTSAAEKYPGVRGVHVIQQVLGKRYFGIPRSNRRNIRWCAMPASP